jgi:hypothetical protein
MIPKIYENFIDNIYIISPFINGGEILNNVFKSVLSVMFDKIKNLYYFKSI